MATIQRRRVSRDAAGNRGESRIPLRARSREDFFWMVAPGAWEYIEEEGCWLPRLKPHYVVPGANGVENSQSIARCIAEREQAGFAVVRPSDPRLGRYRDYVVRMPKDGPGCFHVSIFDGVEVMPGGHVFIQRDTEETVADVGTFNEFRRFLVTEGIVPTLDPRFKQLLIRQLEQKRSRIAKRAAGASAGSPAHDRLNEFGTWLSKASAAGAPEAAGAPAKTPKPRRRVSKGKAREEAEA